MAPIAGKVPNPMASQEGPPWRTLLKVTAALGLACGISAVLIVPYLLEIMPELIEQLPFPVWVFALLTGVQSGVIASVLALVGQLAARPVGLRAPHLERWAAGSGDKPSWAGVGRSALVGVGVALVVVGVDTLLLLPHLNPIGDTPPSPSPFNGLLASFYGGLYEEVMLRLFLMSLVAWLLTKLRVDRRAAVVSAAFIAALLFGVGHLPAAFKIFEPSTLLIVRTLLLNFALGLPFGFIYARRGLEQAIVAHFCADLVLHVAVPLVLGPGSV